MEELDKEQMSLSLHSDS